MTIAVILAAIIFAMGCGSGSSTGQIRLVQASPNAPALDFVLDGTTQASDMLYGNASAYVTVKAGSRRVQAIPVNSTSAIFDSSVSVGDSDNKTVLLTGSSPSLQSVVLTDGGTTTTTTGQTFVRVVNASASMGAADVYLVPAGTGITGVTPVATSLAFDQSGGYQTVATGGYEVLMTSPGTHNILLDTGPINSVTTSQNWTVVILDGKSGGFSFTVLQDQ